MKKLSQKKRLLISLTAFCAAALEYQGANFDKFHKYIRDALFLIAVGSALFGAFHLAVWIWRSYKKKVHPKLKNFWSKMSRSLNLFGEKVRKVFFVPRGSHSLSGRDERSFVRKKNERKSKNIKKWKRLPGLENYGANRDKIRYIYIKLVMDNIRHGFKFDPSSTPNQVIDKLVREESSVFCTLYNGSRYADDSFDVSDSEVADGFKLIRGKS